MTLERNDLLDIIIGTEEAAKLWDVTQDHVKRLCRDGKCISKQIGKTWIILKDQPKPTKKNKDV